MEIAAGYETAFEKASAILPKLIVAKAEELHDVEKVKTYLKASVMSKHIEAHEVVYALAARACGKFLSL